MHSDRLMSGSIKLRLARAPVLSQRSLSPRRFLDKKSGKWKDASSLRPADLPVLQLALAAAREFLTNTPLPGQSIEPEGLERSQRRG